MANEITIEDVRARVPERKEDAHKGTFGHVFVIAGSRGFAGAAILSCKAALRSGVGLTTTGAPSPLIDVIAGAIPESMTFHMPFTEEHTIAARAAKPALEFAESKSAVALGPGLSRHAETVKFVHAFVSLCPVPTIVDADGLNCISENTDVLRDAKAPVIVTPHPGEMARLIQGTTKDVQGDREGTASEFAVKYGCVTVLKGHHTIVATPDNRVWVNPTGGPELATGGTGDVLTGLIGGLLAQGMDAADAAIAAVYVHGLAGEFAADSKTTRAVIATDLIDALPAAWRALE